MNENQNNGIFEEENSQNSEIPEIKEIETKDTEKKADASSEYEKKQRRKRIIACVFSLIMLYGANLIVFFTIWLNGRYDDVNLDQILYQAKASAEGTNGDLMSGALVRVFGLGLLAALLELFIYFVLSGKFSEKWKKSVRYVKYCTSKVCTFFKNHHLQMGAGCLAISCFIFLFRFEVFSYIVTSSTESDFIEENYVDPEKTTLEFPEEKRNLIYIFLESMENTFADTTAGGKVTDNFTPELTQLREENISFSNNESVYGGALSYMGTTWTAAALVSQTSGVTVKVPLFQETYGGKNSYMPGLVTIGDILEENGYNQTVLFGSDARFAARDYYFTEHGNYNIVDIVSLKEEGRLDPDYIKWWGFEDAKLFDYAKEEITKLSESGEPFNFTMLTADSHFPDGYLCEDCPETYDGQYPNVLACSSSKVYEFINWIKEQPFYENTTIVLSGDHLTMDPNFLVDIEEDYTRTVYNCIINSAVPPVKSTNREFGVFDMFPTTLAAMGVKIEGNRLGLGTNLFSSEETLTEKYGYEFLDEEMLKESEYYQTEFFKKDEK